MKPSTALGTDTKKTSNRWFRAAAHRGEIEHLFDLYWGGKERRITGMTLRIIGVNVIALIFLVFGVIYLGQYHEKLVEAKIKQFETEILLVGSAVSGVAVVQSDDNKPVFSLQKAEEIVFRLAQTLGDHLLIFQNDVIVIDSHNIMHTQALVQGPVLKVEQNPQDVLGSVEILKDMAMPIALLLPQHNDLELFHGINSINIKDYPDAMSAKNKNISISAWHDSESKVILTAAVPIINEQQDVIATVMLIGDGADIQAALGDAWFDILKIFLLTLFVTIFLSIYLSGVIAKPLRKLARAAENVRKGKINYSEIPDLSDRNDEIGELSIVLREMTYALWERMDAIESFAADVSHEIKNPLTSLKSAVETMFLVKKEDDRFKLLNVIKHDIERLDRLITDISHASRIDAELSREVFTEIDLKKVLRHLVDAYKSPLEREAWHQGDQDQALKDGVLITLNMHVHGDIKITGSEGRLIQVFQNILSNALSFSPVQSKIKIMIQRNEHHVRVIFEDQGMGIPESKLENIFDRFYSDRPEYEEYGRHSGLGLAICKQIITAHNGMIYAENAQDRSGEITGARFVVILNTHD